MEQDFYVGRLRDRHGLEVLVPERLRGRHTAQRDDYLAHPSVRQMGSGLELYAVRKDGTEFPVEISLAPLETAEPHTPTSLGL